MTVWLCLNLHSNGHIQWKLLQKKKKKKKNCTKRRRRQKKKILDVSAATKTAVVVVLTGVEGFSLTMQVEVKQPSPHQVSYHFSFIVTSLLTSGFSHPGLK